MKELTLEENLILALLIILFLTGVIVVIVCLSLRLMNSSLPAMMLYSGGSLDVASNWHARWDDRGARSYHCQVNVGRADYERTELSNIIKLTNVAPGDYGTIEVTPFDDNETPMRSKRYYIRIPETPVIDRYSANMLATTAGWVEITFNVSCEIFILSVNISHNNSYPFKFTQAYITKTETSRGNWRVRCGHNPFGPLRQGDKVTFDVVVQNDEGSDSIIHSVSVEPLVPVSLA